MALQNTLHHTLAQTLVSTTLKHLTQNSKSIPWLDADVDVVSVAPRRGRWNQHVTRHERDQQRARERDLEAVLGARRVVGEMFFLLFKIEIESASRVQFPDLMLPPLDAFSSSSSSSLRSGGAASAREPDCDARDPRHPVLGSAHERDAAERRRDEVERPAL